MLLSEIAEKIIEKDPEDFLRYAVEVGNREKSYEDSLINPFIDHYLYNELNLCSCGSPDTTLEVIRRYLHIRKEWKDLSYDEVQERYKTELHIDTEDYEQYGVFQFMAYEIDSLGFTDHGSSIGYCWLTERGEMFLTVLDAWSQHNKEN